MALTRIRTRSNEIQQILPLFPTHRVSCLNRIYYINMNSEKLAESHKKLKLYWTHIEFNQKDIKANAGQ
jgi:hypothetical protein